MTHKQVLQSLSGLLLGMFVSILAGTVVSTSLPKIISELGGNQTAFTWVVTSTLLATTVSTPIWGKLADLFDRKLLIQLALGIFVIGSALAGFSQDTSTLIAFRTVQGLGAGGLTALSQIIMADIISPRERGRYMGLFGAVMAVGTIGGPLAGGLITDSFGWRWNFFVALPIAVVAIILLQRTLHLAHRTTTRARIDYLGAALIAGAVSLLLIWVSLAGSQFEWASTTTLWMVGGGVLLLTAAIVVEFRAADPIIPLTLFRNRTFTLSVIASLAVGVAMFGTSVFLGQYMQLARGATPTESGLLTLPMIVGLLLSSTIVGALITRYGAWKRYMVIGAVLLTAGLALMGTIHYDTSYVQVALFMLILGSGVGMVMQNLVLVVQNTVHPQQLGVASSSVAFFRSLGGAAGVAVLGALLAERVTASMTAQQAALQQALAALGAEGQKVAASLASGTIPAVSSLPDGVRQIIESAYGDGIASIFLTAAPLALVSLIAIVFLPNVSLSTQTAQDRRDEVADAAIATAGVTPTGSIAVVADDLSPEDGASRIDGGAERAPGARHAAPAGEAEPGRESGR
ncbi:DHA2 family efflux MFS transporter permease subunit [Mycetocola reblochoni]|nr:DHA2 family efflux MFS transporter permease subunit [Mycetocola reblochoni]